MVQAETVALFREVETLQSQAMKHAREYPAPFDMHAYVDRAQSTTIQLARYYGSRRAAQLASRQLPAVARGTLIYVIRHGHGGPSLVAHAYLEGTSEVYPNIEQNEDVALRPPAES